MAVAFLWGCGEGAPPGETPPSGAPSAAAPSQAAATDLPDGAEAISPTGEVFYPTPLTPELQEQRDRELAEAEADLAADPGSADALIWVGRRQAYLGNYRQAIETFSEGISQHPDDARMYRHRGHRWLTVREFDRAIGDFMQGIRLVEGQPDEVEPDGLPNPQGIPTSTLQFNLWYHLGLAHYLKGDFGEALGAFESCLMVSTNPDARAATSYWIYLTLRRLERDDQAEALLAEFTEDYEVIENQAYLDLLRLFRGDRTAEDLLGESGDAPTLQGTTAAYGVGAWHLVNDRPAEAEDVFRRIVAATEQWQAFGYLAAEAELNR